MGGDPASEDIFLLSVFYGGGRAETEASERGFGRHPKGPPEPRAMSSLKNEDMAKKFNEQLLSQMLATLLFGASPTDVVTYVAVTLLFLLVAIVACL